MFISILDNRGRHDVIHSEPQKQRAHGSEPQYQHTSQYPTAMMTWGSPDASDAYTSEGDRTGPLAAAQQR